MAGVTVIPGDPSGPLPSSPSAEGREWLCKTAGAVHSSAEYTHSSPSPGFMALDGNGVVLSTKLRRMGHGIQQLQV